MASCRASLLRALAAALLGLPLSSSEEESEESLEWILVLSENYFIKKHDLSLSDWIKTGLRMGFLTKTLLKFFLAKVVELEEE
jgi:hypothetical protein